MDAAGKLYVGDYFGSHLVRRMNNTSGERGVQEWLFWGGTGSFNKPQVRAMRLQQSRCCMAGPCD